MADLRKTRIKEFVNKANQLKEDNKEQWAGKTAD